MSLVLLENNRSLLLGEWYEIWATYPIYQYTINTSTPSVYYYSVENKQKKEKDK